SFSYFDPETERYVTKATAPITMDIGQGSAPAATALPASALAAETPKAKGDGLTPDQLVTGQSVVSLHPLVLAPWFIAVNAMMMAALVVGAMWRLVRQRRANDPTRFQREALEKSVRDSLAKMDDAVKAHDAPRFFAAARTALQERLAAK